MNQKQFLLTLLVAVISGSLGGALSVWFLMPPSVLAQDEPQKVIEAQEFRLLDDEGTVRSRWITSSMGGAILIFQHEDGTNVADFGNFFGAPQLSMGTYENRMVVLRVSSSGDASLTLSDRDGNSRAAFGRTELKNNRTGSTEIRAPSSLILFDEEGKVVWERHRDLKEGVVVRKGVE